MKIANLLKIVNCKLRIDQRGEIATVLTLISVGLMLAGLVVGNVAVQQTTQTQSRAAGKCYAYNINPNTGINECGERDPNPDGSCPAGYSPGSCSGSPPPAACASGWVCGNKCADQSAVNSFNGYWCDGKAAWLVEAGCGGSGSIPKADPRCRNASASKETTCSDTCKSNPDGSEKFCYNECIPDKPGYLRSVSCTFTGWKWGTEALDSSCGQPAAPPATGDCPANMCYPDSRACATDETDTGQSCKKASNLNWHCCVPKTAASAKACPGQCSAELQSCNKDTEDTVSGTICENSNSVCCVPKTETTDSAGNKCSPSKLDVTGACNFACCGTNSDCGTGGECGIPNGYCKAGKSCAPNAPGSSKPLYVRTCQGATCAWTFCDGKNVDLKICTEKDPLTVTSDDPSTLCDTNEECKSFVPTAAPGVNKCRLTGQATFAEAKQVDCPATYQQCYSEGKSVLVHRDCTQSNESGCIYWCETKDGKRTGCGPADGPDAKTSDDPGCKTTPPEEPTVECSKRGGTCTKGKCPDDSEAKVISCEGSKYGDANELNCCVPKPASTTGTKTVTKVGTTSAACGLPVGNYYSGLSSRCISCIARENKWLTQTIGGQKSLRETINAKSSCADTDLAQYWCSGGRSIDNGEQNNQSSIHCMEQYMKSGKACANDCQGVSSSTTSRNTSSGSTFTGSGCTVNIPTERQQDEKFNVSATITDQANYGATDTKIIFRKSGTMTTVDTVEIQNEPGSTNKWSKSDVSLATTGDYDVIFKYTKGTTKECNTGARIKITAKGTSTSSTVKVCNEEIVKVDNGCYTCVTRELPSNQKTAIDKETQCTNLKQNFAVTCKSKSDYLEKCTAAITTCSPTKKNECNQTDTSRITMSLMSYDNTSFDKIVEAKKQNLITAIDASIYVLNATRVPGLQRLYCDPFKGQCDFYYQNPQVGT